MPSSKKEAFGKQKKVLHPNSRKMLAITKKNNRAIHKEQSKLAGTIKQNLIREKILWIQEHMVPDICPYTPELTAELLEKYIARHDEELDLIAQKNKVPNKKNRSHASREDILRMNKERDHDEYNGCGIEIPNILNSTQCEMLRKWDGDVRYLPNFVFRRFGKRHVEEMQRKILKSESKPVKPKIDTTASSEKETDQKRKHNDQKLKTDLTKMDTD
ncbi:translation machinery-associated protein 16 [Chelonus insularis]|uniref:translation machinery-associated protein 16 n=1 Tax=Chelonus insularis TaxID=460826 RepID=UPI00158E2699|nr:translation machinery-associated protein 16 [Chelonus insularis]